MHDPTPPPTSRPDKWEEIKKLIYDLVHDRDDGNMVAVQGASQDSSVSTSVSGSATASTAPTSQSPALTSIPGSVPEKIESPEAPPTMRRIGVPGAPLGPKAMARAKINVAETVLGAPSGPRAMFGGLVPTASYSPADSSASSSAQTMLPKPIFGSPATPPPKKENLPYAMVGSPDVVHTPPSRKSKRSHPIVGLLRAAASPVGVTKRKGSFEAWLRKGGKNGAGEGGEMGNVQGVDESGTMDAREEKYELGEFGRGLRKSSTRERDTEESGWGRLNGGYEKSVTMGRSLEENGRAGGAGQSSWSERVKERMREMRKKDRMQRGDYT